MRRLTRRALLAATAGVAGGAAGCSALSDDTAGRDNPPAGSLQFRNDHVAPHDVQLAVTDVGSRLGDESNEPEGEVRVGADEELTASYTADPDETETFQGVFAHAVWYAVEFTVDGRQPGDSGRYFVVFNPAPPGRDRGNFLQGHVTRSGEFSWGIVSTDDLGPFEEG